MFGFFHTRQRSDKILARRADQHRFTHGDECGDVLHDAQVVFHSLAEAQTWIDDDLLAQMSVAMWANGEANLSLGLIENPDLLDEVEESPADAEPDYFL